MEKNSLFQSTQSAFLTIILCILCLSTSINELNGQTLQNLTIISSNNTNNNAVNGEQDSVSWQPTLKAQQSTNNYHWDCSCKLPADGSKYCQNWNCISKSYSLQCFPESSLVTLSNNQKKNMGELQVGDKILTFDKKTNQIIEDEIIGFLHSEQYPELEFYEIFYKQDPKEDNLSNSIKISANHLIFIKHENDIKEVFAKNVKNNDQILALNNEGNEMKFTSVIKIEKIKLKGMYAPLTYQTGTLIVDNIYSSNYANVEDHQKSHMGFALYRFAHKYLPKQVKLAFDFKMSDGINLYTYFLMQISKFMPKHLNFLENQDQN